MPVAKKQRKEDADAASNEQPKAFFNDMAALEAAMEHLRIADARLAPLIEQHGTPERLLSKDTSCFRSLAKSIIYQQLAGSAAAAIYARFLTACKLPDESHLTPAAVLAAPLSTLRACGLSERKASYLLDLAAHFEDGRLSDELLTSVSPEELLQRLTAVRGIGPWTVDMFAMFHLGSPDILPVGDLGVRKGLAHLCGLKNLPTPSEMQELTAAWQPYRSLGCYYMWRIPLPPKASSSKGNGSSSSSKAKAKASRALAPAFPLGGAVPAVADVGVNPLAPVLAAAAAAAVGGAGSVAAEAVSGAATSTVAQQGPTNVTPAKPRWPAAAASDDGCVQQATAGGGAAAATGQQQPQVEGVVTRRQLRWAQQAAVQGAAGTGAAAGPAAAAVAGGGGVSQPASVGSAGLKARIVDLG